MIGRINHTCVTVYRVNLGKRKRIDCVKSGIKKMNKIVNINNEYHKY